MYEKRLAKKISLFEWGIFVLFGQFVLTCNIAVLLFAGAHAMRARQAISLDIFKLKNIFIMI